MSCHNVEHLPICIRFVDSECKIREELVFFIGLKRVRACDIADAIITPLKSLGLSLSNLRGQGYDGAATMSGAKSGVRACIDQQQPKAVYTHYAGHSFNLAIKILVLVQLLEPKREGILKAVGSKTLVVSTVGAN